MYVWTEGGPDGFESIYLEVMVGRSNRHALCFSKRHVSVTRPVARAHSGEVDSISRPHLPTGYLIEQILDSVLVPSGGQVHGVVGVLVQVVEFVLAATEPVDPVVRLRSELQASTTSAANFQNARPSRRENER